MDVTLPVTPMSYLQHMTNHSGKPKNSGLMKTAEIVSYDLPEEDAAGGGDDARQDYICCQSPFIQCRARPSSFRSSCRVHRAQRKM